MKKMHAVTRVEICAVFALALISAVDRPPIADDFGKGTPALTRAVKSSRVSSSSQRVWVALENDDRLAYVGIRKGHVIRKRKVPGGPHNLVVNRAGTVAAALWHDRRVAIVRKGSVKNVVLGGAPHDVKMGGGRILVANQGSNRLQLLSFKGKRRGRIVLKTDPHDVAISPNGYIAWATLEGTDQLARVNLRKKKVLRYMPTGKSPHDILFSPTGRLWVTDWNGAIHVYSRKGKHLKSRALGDEAHHLAFTRDGRQVWVTDHSAHRVFVLSTRSMRLLKSFPIKGAPHHVTITRDGEKAVVADHDRGLLVVYRVATLKRVARIPVGSGPHGIWNAP
jgi:DNA-binding beta-propeller fold protein YncE